MSADLHFENHGSVMVLFAESDTGREWVDENLYVEPWQRIGEAVAIEARAARDVAEAALEAGLVVT